ncbi:cell division protein MinJ, partial [Lacticaseibacillus rhamnosus]
MAVIIALLISPIGAVFWLALGLTILYAVSRTSRERHQYLRAIHPQHSEIAPFFWVGILLGIVISALMLVARLQVSLPALISIK